MHFSKASSEDSDHTWEVSLSVGSTAFDISPPNTNTFFFGIEETDNPDNYFLSHYFDITEDTPSLTSTTTAPTSSTTTLTHSSTTSTVTKGVARSTTLLSGTIPSLPTSASSSINSTPTPSLSPPVTNHDLSVGAKAGTGVGVSAAGFAILALVFWYCFRARRKRRISPRVQEEYTPNIYQGEFTQGGFASASQAGIPEKSTADISYYSNQTEVTPVSRH